MDRASPHFERRHGTKIDILSWTFDGGSLSYSSINCFLLALAPQSLIEMHSQGNTDLVLMTPMTCVILASRYES